MKLRGYDGRLVPKGRRRKRMEVFCSGDKVMRLLFWLGLDLIRRWRYDPGAGEMKKMKVEAKLKRSSALEI